MTAKGQYATRAMVEIGMKPNQIHRIRDIAAEAAVPMKFLEHILLQLKNAGLLHSRRGVSGGYYLARPPSEIDLAQIVRAVDGPLAPVSCVSGTAYERCTCPDESLCGLRLIWKKVRDATAQILEETTLEEVCRLTTELRKPALEPEMYFI